MLAGFNGLVLKVWYFCYFSSISTIFPYTNLYFRRLGLSESQIGLLAAFRPWVSFPAGSLWSGVADKLRAHRAVLLLLFAASTVLRLSLAAASSFGVVMSLVLGTEFFSAAVTIIVDAAVMAACPKEGEYARQRLFGAVGWGIFSAVAGATISHKGIFSAFVCHAALALLTAVPTALIPFGPLHAKLGARAYSGTGSGQAGTEGEGAGLCEGQAHQLQLLRAGRRKEGDVQLEPHGQIWEGWPVEQRKGGSNGGWEAARSWEEAHGEAAADVERRPLRLLDPASEVPVPVGVIPSQATPGSSTGLTLSEVGGQTAAGCPRVGQRQQDFAEGQHQQWQATGGGGRQEGQLQHGQPAIQYWDGMARLLLNPQALVFYGMVLTMGFGVGNIEGYLFLYLDSLGAPETLMGLSLTMTCAAESLVFWFSGHMLRALGAKLCMHLVFLAFLVRLLCYATLAHWGNPWKVLPVELLHGFTFALAWATGTAFASKVAPPGLEATAQALFQGLYFGVGYGIGGLVGGAVYQHWGAQQVYWVAFTVMLAGWLLGGAAEVVLGWCCPNEDYAPLETIELTIGCEGTAGPDCMQRVEVEQEVGSRKECCAAESCTLTIADQENDSLTSQRSRTRQPLREL